MRLECPSCSATLMAVGEIVSVVVEDVRPTQKMGGWDPAPPLDGRPGTHVQTIGELGLCAGPASECDGCSIDDPDTCLR